MYYSILLPTLPLVGEICPTVVENMSGLVVMGEKYLWLSLNLLFWIEGVGWDELGLFSCDGLKFF